MTRTSGVEFHHQWHDLAVVNEGGSGSVSPELAMAVVGGIQELVLQAIEEGRVARLAELTGTVAQLVKAVAHRGN
jgi:hypothetical protein